MSDDSELIEEPDSASGQESTATGHPSQAEGEDPDATGGGEDSSAVGHPSQAEGEDPDATGGSGQAEGEVMRDRVDDPADPDPVDEHSPSSFGAPPTAVISDAADADPQPAARDE